MTLTFLQPNTLWSLSHLLADKWKGRVADLEEHSSGCRVSLPDTYCPASGVGRAMRRFNEFARTQPGESFLKVPEEKGGYLAPK